MNDIKGIFEFRDIRRRTRVVITEQQLEDWRRIDDTPVSFAKTTGSRSDGLLSNMELIPFRAKTQSVQGFRSSHESHYMS